MTKTILLLGMLATTWSMSAQKARNTLLEQSFWATKPTLEAVKAEVQRGHSPAESNSRAMDVATIAINNDAPLDVIQYLVEQEGNSVAKQTHHFRTYLHWAAARGRVEVINYLIAKGADIKALDEHGTTPLFYAIGGGVRDTAVLEAFAQAGFDLKYRNREGSTLMMQAIANDKNFALTSYLQHRGLQLSDTDSSGATLFDYAARTGDVAHLKALLARGVNPTGQAILMAAQGTRRSANTIGVYRYLIEELGQDPLTIGKAGNTLLHTIATKPNQVEIATYLVGKGVDPKAKNVDGNTACILASGSRHLDLVQYLLPLSGDLSTANNKGETALTMAMKSGSPEVAEYLIGLGADARVANINGHNLVYYLAQHYREAMPSGVQGGAPQRDEFVEKLALLKKAGVDLAAPQVDGSTLYHYAASRGSLGMLDKVSQLGIDINAINSEGLTALHKAALTAKDTAVLHRLLELGADKGVRTELDETAYDLALENGYLKRAGADISFLKQ